MITGRCNCGAIRFELAETPSGVIMCHCSICRRSTGANGIPVVILKNSAFRWTEGEGLVRHWKKPDADWETAFCPRCGSKLPGRNDESHMYIPAGLLDRAPDLEVTHHIWVGSKAGWDKICDNGEVHDGAFGA